MIEIKNWYLDNLYRWAMSQNLHSCGFKWVGDISQFNEDFIKSYNEDNDEGYFFEVDVEYLEELHDIPFPIPFLVEKMKVEKVEKLLS